MDVAALSMAISQNNVSSSVNMSLIKMAKDQMEQNAVQIIEMISDTAATIDLKV